LRLQGYFSFKEYNGDDDDDDYDDDDDTDQGPDFRKILEKT